MTELPQVKNTVEMTILNHRFRFRRLRWHDMPAVNGWIDQHKMVDHLAVTAHALENISGRDVTPQEALTVLLSMPRSVQETIFKYYKGNLDPHRMFATTPLWKAPEAAEFKARIDEEESETDATMDEVEELLAQKFGRKALDEERELSRQIVEGTGYAGATKREEEFLDAAVRDMNEREDW